MPRKFRSPRPGLTMWRAMWRASAARAVAALDLVLCCSSSFLPPARILPEKSPFPDLSAVKPKLATIRAAHHDHVPPRPLPPEPRKRSRNVVPAAKNSLLLSRCMKTSSLIRSILFFHATFKVLASPSALSTAQHPRLTMTDTEKDGHIGTKKMSQLLFTSLEKEGTIGELPVTGSIPKWLKGTLAMLHSFSFDGSGKVAYENKLLDTANLRAHRKANKIAAKEFVSAPKTNLLNRVVGLFGSSESIPYETANVNIAKAGGKYFAMSEVPRWIEFEIPSVATKGVITFSDSIADSAQMSCAHPLSSAEGDVINFVTCFGKDHFYCVYKIKPEAPGHTQGKLERELIAKIPTEHAAYMHSFGLTDDYIVLVEFPWHFSLTRMLSSGASTLFTGIDQGFDSIFEWRPERGTIFTVVRTADGSVVGKYKAPSFFAYHIANTFVDPSDPAKLHVDMMCYEKVFYDDFSLHTLRNDAFGDQHPGKLMRYTVALDAAEEARRGGDAVTSAVLFDGVCEFPVVNDKMQGKPYRYVYGTGLPGSASPNALPSLLRVDCQSGETKVWEVEGCYPGEGVFVAAAEGGAEDNGVVLSVVIDEKTERSFLLIVDATSMQEIARADLPHHIPLGLHGFFFK